MKKLFLPLLMLLATMSLSAQLTYLPLKNGEGSTNPGTSGNPYLITSTQNLDTLRKVVSNAVSTAGLYFEMTNDIDLSGQDWVAIGVSEYLSTSSTTTNKQFMGIFDGKGYTISGLKLGTPTAGVGKTSYGFFAYTKDATVKNIKFTNVAIYVNHSGSSTYVGAAVGNANNTDVINCSVVGIIKATNSNPTGSNCCVGGVVGWLKTGSAVVNCHVNARLYAASTNITAAGGVVGGTDNPSGTTIFNSIINCSSVGSSSINVLTTSTTAVQGAAGILGCQFANTNAESSTQLKIANCYTNDTISATRVDPTVAGLIFASGIATNKAAKMTLTNCIAACPSITINSANTADKIKRVVHENIVTGAYANVSGNLAYEGMTLKVGNPLVTVNADNTKVSDGADLGSSNYLTLLNNYVTTNPTFTTSSGSVVNLTSWDAGITTVSDVLKVNNSNIKLSLAEGKLRINGLLENDQVAVYTLKGQLIWKGNSANSNIELPVSRGCYLVQVKSVSGVSTYKVL